MSARTNRTITLRTIEAVNETLASGDLSLLDDFFTPDFIHHNADSANQTTRDDLKRYLEHARTAFPDLRVAIDDIVAEGDRVAARLNIHGTHLGTWGNQPPTGEAFVWSDLQILRVTGGMVVESWGRLARAQS